jgi:hypothetical protein
LRFFIGAFFALLLSVDTKAQTEIGVDWDSSEQIEEFKNKLELFKELNAAFIILDRKTSVEYFQVLEEHEIPFLLRLNNRFITQAQFKADSSSYLDDLNSIAAFDSSNFFKGFILFSDSDVSPFSINTDVKVYFEQNQTLLSSSTNNTFSETPVFFSSPRADAKSIYEFRSKSTEHSIVIVDDEWLKLIVEEFPELRNTFSFRSGFDPHLIALPQLLKESPTLHWSIVVLLLLWISLAINVATNPTYLETIPRYFTAHRFFVDDIMSYRERSSVSGVFLLFQHAFFGGLIVYILSKTFISSTGLEALYYHLPYIAILGQNYFSLFGLSSLLIFVIELIAVMWIYFPNKGMSHFNQALNLFTWIFHLDFLLVTLLITLFFSGASSTTLSIFACIYVLIWFSSFNITAFDASKRLGMTRNKYLFNTIVLHTIVSGSVLVLLVIYNRWLDLLKLIISV